MAQCLLWGRDLKRPNAYQCRTLNATADKGQSTGLDQSGSAVSKNSSSGDQSVGPRSPPTSMADTTQDRAPPPASEELRTLLATMQDTLLQKQQDNQDQMQASMDKISARLQVLESKKNQPRPSPSHLGPNQKGGDLLLSPDSHLGSHRSGASDVISAEARQAGWQIGPRPTPDVSLRSAPLSPVPKKRKTADHSISASDSEPDDSEGFFNEENLEDLLTENDRQAPELSDNDGDTLDSDLIAELAEDLALQDGIGSALSTALA